MALARAASTASLSRFESQVAAPPSLGRGAGRVGEPAQRVAGPRRRPVGPQLLELGLLLGQHVGVVDPQHLDGLVGVDPVLVDADDRLAAGVDAGLRAGRGLLDAQLGDAVVDRLGHAAVLGDLLDVRPGAAGEVVGQLLDVGRPAPRVDDPRRAGLLLQQQLGVAGDPGGEVGRQGQRLVEGVGVQRLGVPLGGGHRLEAGADDVVVDVLRGQRPARRLRVGAQRQRLRVLRAGLLHQLGPEQPPRTELGDLHEEVHADRPEERQPRREGVDVHARRLARPQVLDAVGEGVGQLQVGRRPGLLDVVAGDRDRVEPRHLAAR